MKAVLISGSLKKLEIYDKIISFINENIKEEKIISFVASTFDEYNNNDYFVNKLVHLFNEKNIFFDKVNIIDSRISNLDMKVKINNSNIIFLLGGDTLKQIDYINKYDLKDVIKNNNKIIIGISAGAINMATKVVLAKDEEDNISELSLYDGVGITDINIEPHCNFNSHNHWQELCEASNYSKIVVMNDDCFVIINDNEINYYGTYLFLNKGKIEYNGHECSLKEFLKEIDND